ncbi:MAG: serine/threonine protein kinase [Gallionella sp.]|nr:serine/threonine protein kinase [Gallionella sp.]
MISQLGRYEVLSELGQGAMGVVYKAKDPLIDRIVAIKTINLGLALDEKEEYEGRFYQEAKAAGRLSHPNIVTIYDVGRNDEVAYIAMEFLEGRELRDIMNDEGLLPVHQILDIVAQVASGLAYAHENGIVHRDVKPSNIMVVRDGHVKITDFGIARMASSSVRTQTGMVLGSPKYMSPEQVMGKLIDQRSDIFSLGVMLYEMLTGQAPFTGDNVNAIMYQTLNTIPSPPNTLNGSVPEMVNFIVAKALSKGLDDRYQDAKDFADDLRSCRDMLPRSGLKVDFSKLGGERKLPDAFDITARMDANEEAARTTSQMVLSQAFDSAAATMRLAALTSNDTDVDELSKTLQMERPSAEAIKQAGLKAKALQPVKHKSWVDPSAQTASGGFLLLMILLLVLIGAISIFVL